MKNDCPKLEEVDTSRHKKSSSKRGLDDRGDPIVRIAALEAEIQRLKESMPKSGESTDHKKKKAKTDSKKVNWNKFVGREERGSDEESDQE